MSRVRAIAGLDAARGLHSLRGRESAYCALLGTFAGNHTEDMSHARQALFEERTADARRIAHSLKGAAASLGLKAIEASARRLEAAISDSARFDLLAPQMQELEKLLLDTSAAIVTALGGGQATAPLNHDHEAAAGVIRTLAQLLADDAPAATGHAREHGALLQAALGDAWPDIQRQIAAFDLPGAASSLAAAGTRTHVLKDS